MNQAMSMKKVVKDITVSNNLFSGLLILIYNVVLFNLCNSALNRRDYYWVDVYDGLLMPTYKTATFINYTTQYYGNIIGGLTFIMMLMMWTSGLSIVMKKILF
jgi:hypothetical protein